MLNKEENKKCTRCGLIKSRLDFWPQKERNGQKFNKLGQLLIKGECKQCSKKLSNDWRRLNPLKAKNLDLKKLYGITLDTYNAMLKKQNFKCAICGSNKSFGKGSFHVDHDHSTGVIRGLLCHFCNIGIGIFKHDAHILDKAKKYILKNIG